MNIKAITNKIYTNKIILNSLKKVSEHGTSFSAATSLVLSTVFRPLSINYTPKVEKENKNYAMANSISSGLIKFAIVESIALPIEKAINKIDNNPTKFLKSNTIEQIKNNPKPFKALSQILKLTPAIITAIPKSMLTIALIPIIMDKLFKTKKEPEKLKENYNTLSFKGHLTNKISKIYDTSKIINLTKKLENKIDDIPKNMTIFTDLLLIGSSITQIHNSNKIKENRKKPLIYNNLVATLITITGGYSLDNLIKKTGKSTIESFKQANINNPNLEKYLEGINIIRPAIIFAGIYYIFIPIISTYLSERIDKFCTKQNVNNQKA